MTDGWIFAYGSLMWDPGVPVAEVRRGRLHDWQRSFCLRSIQHRGTPECPGLVLGLDAAPGSVCEGLALRVAAADWPAAHEAIRTRELVTQAYREELLPVETDGGAVEAVTYVMRRDHWQYAGGLALEEQAAMIARACGGRGENRAYLEAFLAHLHNLGIEDPEFETLGRLTRALGRAAPAP